MGLVGTGLVGSSFAYALVIRGIASELVLVDVNNDKAIGEMMDFNHGLSFVRPMKIAAGGYEDLAGSHIVVIAAGASQKPGESRLDLLGMERALIYKTLFLTGLRRGELASLTVGQLDLDGPKAWAFVNAADEKNRHGSESVPELLLVSAYLQDCTDPFR